MCNIHVKPITIAGSMYWRFDEVVSHVELDYPRDISMWSGVQAPIDSVFKDFDGKTYFFKGQKFWEFDDVQMKARARNTDVQGDDDPEDTINVRFLKCPPRELIRDPFRTGSTISNLGSSIWEHAYYDSIFTAMTSSVLLRFLA